MSDKVSLPDEAWAALIVVAQKRKIYIEGNILKILDPGDSKSYQEYLESAIACDKDRQEKRLLVTKQVQSQNKDLLEAQRTIRMKTDKAERALEEMSKAKLKTEEALAEAESARKEAEEARKQAESAWKDAKNDLDYMQKQTQFELMGSIVRVALWVVISVGGITTAMYAAAIFGSEVTESNTTLLANTWSNMFGILLTNSFSIIGTIMGVKYATEGRES